MHTYNGNISFFCHCSDLIGLGHLRRCTRIIQTLQENFGLGTHLHVQGEKLNLPWFSGKVTWYKNDSLLQQAFSSEKSPVLIIDFQLKSIKLKTWQSLLDQQHLRGTKLIALDQLSPLSDHVDKVFVPSFFSDSRSDNILYGWENYLFLPQPNKPVNPPYILVLTGGSDALKFGDYLPDILDDTIPHKYKIYWLKGPLAPPPRLAPTSRIKVLDPVPDAQDLISGASAIISSYGTALYESITSGAAVLLLPCNGLVSQKEVQALKYEDVCLIAETQEDIKHQLHTLTHHSSLIDILKNNALEKGSRIQGLKNLSEMVVSLLDNIPQNS